MHALGNANISVVGIVCMSTTHFYKTKLDQNGAHCGEITLALAFMLLSCEWEGGGVVQALEKHKTTLDWKGAQCGKITLVLAFMLLSCEWEGGGFVQALEKLAFQNVGCSIHACLAVEELMQNTGELRVFHFHNNMSGDEGAAAIAQVLHRSF